jgi:hypothetical protein
VCVLAANAPLVAASNSKHCNPQPAVFPSLAQRTAGLNLGPVIASVGGVGVVVGFATQGLLMNAISAIALVSGGVFGVWTWVGWLEAGLPQARIAGC